jgi:hypothetical protein
MNKEEFKRLEKGKEIIYDIDRAKSTIGIVDNLLSENDIKEGMMVVSNGHNSTRVPLTQELCGILLKVVYHALKHDIKELKKEFEEL